jgi:8-oxo-dGTP pyrophosphatase MutT (NUDIX family)
LSDFVALVSRLESALRADLPGIDAQRMFVPPRPRGWPPGFDPQRIRHAAGLLLVFPIVDRAHIVLTVRAGTLGRHSGQVSLPGGRVEPGETIEQAALREAHEEVGLPLDNVRVLGALTPLDIPVSGFRLHPIVAVTGTRAVLRPSDGEVARILEVDVDDLVAPGRLISIRRERDGRAMIVPAFRAGGEEIWGATAMALAEFLTLLGWIPESPGEVPEKPT